MMVYSAWLKLPITTRHKLAVIFKIPKKGATEVVSDDVVKDGYNIHDIDTSITKEAMQVFLGSTMDNFQHLWEDTLAVVENRPATLHGESFTAATEEEPVNTAEDVDTLLSPAGGAIDEMLKEDVVEPVKPKNKGGRPRKTKGHDTA